MGVDENLVISSPVVFQSTGSSLLDDLMGVVNSFSEVFDTEIININV